MGWGGYSGYGFRPYVPVAVKKAQALKQAIALAKKQGRQSSPVKIEGRKIAKTFWGLAWCDNLASYSDFANRLPRGATYVRNGSVVDLVIKSGKIEALVAGSETYEVTIAITKLDKKTWTTIKQDCSAAIDSLLDLMAGKFSAGVMQRLTRQQDGLFPSPREIKLQCSCPDYSDCCKHIAAVMYGVGARLDRQPELLFELRGVDHQELVSAAVADDNLSRELAAGSDNALAGMDLGELFGIDLDSPAAVATPAVAPARRRSAKRAAEPTPAVPSKVEKAARKSTSKPTTKATATASLSRPVKKQRLAKPSLAKPKRAALKRAK